MGRFVSCSLFENIVNLKTPKRSAVPVASSQRLRWSLVAESMAEGHGHITPATRAGACRVFLGMTYSNINASHKCLLRSQMEDQPQWVRVGPQTV